MFLVAETLAKETLKTSCTIHTCKAAHRRLTPSFEANTDNGLLARSFVRRLALRCEKHKQGWTP